MDIQSDKYRSKINRLGSFSSILIPMLAIGRRLIMFFTLTEEDRLAAGIYLGDDGRE